MRINHFWFRAAWVCAALIMAACANAPLALTRAEIPAPHYDCKRANAISLNLDRFAANPQTYVGRCIHARGFKIANFFYPHLTEFYSGWGEPDSYKAIRLFGKEGRTASNFQEVRETVDLTALAYSCREWNRRVDEELQAESIRISERGSPVTLIPSGHPCPPFNDRDAILLVSEWRIISGMPRRLAGPGPVSKYGRLLDVTDDWAPAAQVRAVAERWFDAVRRRDVDAFMDATGSSEDERDDVRKLLGSDRAAVRFLFGKAVNPTIKYFRTRPTLEEHGVLIEAESRAFGCVCRTADCTNLWPIDWNDTEFDREWPYFCVEVSRNSDGQFSLTGQRFYLYELAEAYDS